MNNLPPGMTKADLAHINCEDCVDVEDLLSECCTAPMIGSEEDGLCSSCLEHSEGVRADQGED